MWPQVEKVRPLGIIVLTVLTVILGVFALMAGAFMFLAASFVSVHGHMPMHYVVMACIYFVTAYGYWTGMGWAWMLGLALAILGIVLGVLSFPCWDTRCRGERGHSIPPDASGG